MICLFILKMVCCVYLLESPRREHTIYFHVKETREDIPTMPPELAL